MAIDASVKWGMGQVRVEIYFGELDSAEPFENEICYQTNSHVYLSR